MQKTIYRQVGSMRRTPQPRTRSSTASNTGFGSLLARLGIASQQLKAARKRR